MDRLFGHHVFAVLVAATIGIGLVPPLVEEWTRQREEAIAQQALDRMDAMQDRPARGGRQPGDPGWMPAGARTALAAIGVALLAALAGWWRASRQEVTRRLRVWRHGRAG